MQIRDDRDLPQIDPEKLRQTAPLKRLQLQLRTPEEEMLRLPLSAWDLGQREPDRGAETLLVRWSLLDREEDDAPGD